MNSYRGINLVFICSKVYNKILLNGIQRFKDPILRRNHARLVRSVEEDKGCKMDQGRESDGMTLGVTIPWEQCGLQIQFKLRLSIQQKIGRNITWFLMPWENIMAQASGCPVKDKSFFACCKMKTNRSLLGKRVNEIKLNNANMRIWLTSLCEISLSLV